MSTTATAIITGAYRTLQIIGRGESTCPADLLMEGFRRLNLMMGSWATQPLTIPVVAREVFPTVAGKGSPSNPYTVGTGGDLNTNRPILLNGAGLILNPGQPNEVEIPRALYTDDAYQNLRIKTLTNSLFTGVYYNATFSGGFGTLFLWPVPNGSQPTSIVLYRPQQLGQFTSPTATYFLPEGADLAVEYNVAMLLADMGAVPADRLANVQNIARTSLAAFKRSNTKIVDMPIDAAFTQGQTRRGGYDINVGDTVGSY